MSKSLIERPDWGAGGEVRHVQQPDNAIDGLDKGRTVDRARGKRKLPDWRDGQPVERRKASAPSAANLDKLGLPPGIVKSWASDPAGVEHRLANVEAAVEVFAGLHDDEQGDIADGFENLPLAVQDAVLEQLGAGLPGHARAVDPDIMRAISESPEGRVMRRHLGSDAALEKLVRTTLHRVRLIRQALDEDDDDELCHFIAALSPRQMIAAYIALGGA